MDPNQNNNPAYPKPDNTPVEPQDPTVIEPTTPPQAETPQTPEPSPAYTNPPVTPTEPATVPNEPTPPANQGQGIVTGGAEPLFTMEPKKRSKKIAIIAAASVVLLAVAGAGFYFGYYTNSKLAYDQALNNSGKALDEITNELTAKPQVAYKGYTGSGTYKYDSASYSTDGNLSFKSDTENSEFKFDVGVGVTRVEIELRGMKSASSNPDIYFKAGGIRGLGDMVGPEFGAITTKYDNKWIVIDHTLLDNAQKQLIAADSGMPPTSEQIVSAVNNFSDVNRQYLFSTDEDKAVATIKNDYGMKTVDGRKVFHYEVGVNKPNLKKYIAAQETALKNSKLNDYIKQNDYTKSVENYFDDAIKSVDEIKATDTVDMYVDANKRIIYKFTKVTDTKNPAMNFVDVGFDYKGGDELPFFVKGVSKEGDTTSKIDMKLTANASTKLVTFKLNFEDDSTDKIKVTTDLKFQPSTSTVTIAKPTGAVPLATLFEELGLGDPFAAYSSEGQTLGASTSSLLQQVQQPAAKKN